MEENWDSEEEVEEEEMGDGEEQAEVTRGILVLVLFFVFSFCLFKTCTFFGTAFSCFHTLYLLGALTVRSICRRMGAGPSSPTFGPGRQTGTG